MEAVLRERLETPLGPLWVGSTADGLREILWAQPGSTSSSGDSRAARVHIQRFEDQVQRYLGGQLRAFSVALDPVGTAFQRAAWEALRAIPFGETRSYGDQAAALGRPTAVRAVAAANGRNPLSIVVPCHRVIGADGSLTGYAGGLEVKRRLLELEGTLPPTLF